MSGHLDLTAEEFAQHYVPKLHAAWLQRANFVVGDAPGCDFMVQRWLRENGTPDRAVRVYHMLENPRHSYGSGHGSRDPNLSRAAWVPGDPRGGYPLVGGFESDEARDAAMTAASNADIAWVRPSGSKRHGSGTRNNLARRVRVYQEQAAAQERHEFSSWPRYRMAQNEAWPVYSAAPAEQQLGENGDARVPGSVDPDGWTDDAHDLVPLPPELVARYEKAREEYWACQRELERHWNRWNDKLAAAKRTAPRRV